jgi:phospholipid/cholesterol/gamma-HCH transport system substrate-binding protein
MKINSAQKTKTGVMVIVCLLLLFALLYLVGKQQKLFGNSFTVFVNFKNIAGAKEGNYVRFAGINTGTISEIALLNDTTVRLTLSLDKSIRKHLKKDATATIGSDGLMGDKLIIIHPGTRGDSTAVEEGETIQSLNPVDVDKIMNNLSRITSNADTITSGLSTLIGRINNGQGTIGRMMTDNKMADKLEGTVTTIKEAAGNVNQNMEAAKKSFLLRGYFRKKERKRIKDSIENAKKNNIEVKVTEKN